jgi:hypothetical protein
MMLKIVWEIVEWGPEHYNEGLVGDENVPPRMAEINKFSSADLEHGQYIGDLYIASTAVRLACYGAAHS